MHWKYEDSLEISELCHTDRWKSIEEKVKERVKVPVNEETLHLLLVRLGMPSPFSFSLIGSDEFTLKTFRKAGFYVLMVDLANFDSAVGLSHTLLMSSS